MSHFKLLVSVVLLSAFNLPSTALAQWGHGPGRHAGPGFEIDWDSSDGDWREERETTKTYELELNGQIFRGQGQRIRLKQELLAANPRLRNLENAKIESLVVLAKSRRGNGSIELQIGNNSADRQSIYEARRGTFQDSSPRSYNKIDFIIPRRQSDGAWILILDGVNKVQTIKITITTRSGGGHGPAPAPRLENLNLGNLFIARPVLPSAQTYSVNALVKSIKLKSLNSAVQVLDVTVELTNGQRYSVQGLQVLLFPGQEIEIAQSNREQVRRISILASSFQPNAQINISTLIQR